MTNAGYADAFRRFVLELRRPDEPGAELSVGAFAEAVGVPKGTIKDWLKAAPLEEDTGSVRRKFRARGRHIAS